MTKCISTCQCLWGACVLGKIEEVSCHLATRTTRKSFHFWCGDRQLRRAAEAIPAPPELCSQLGLTVGVWSGNFLVYLNETSNLHRFQSLATKLSNLCEKAGYQNHEDPDRMENTSTKEVSNSDQSIWVISFHTTWHRTTHYDPAITLPGRQQAELLLTSAVCNCTRSLGLVTSSLCLRSSGEVLAKGEREELGRKWICFKFQHVLAPSHTNRLKTSSQPLASSPLPWLRCSRHHLQKFEPLLERRPGRGSFQKSWGSWL